MDRAALAATVGGQDTATVLARLDAEFRDIMARSGPRDQVQRSYW